MTGTFEAIQSTVVRRSSDPSDVVVSVEGYSFLTVLGTDQLQTIIMNKDCGSATLTGVGLHSLFDGVNRWGTVSMISKVSIERIVC